MPVRKTPQKKLSLAAARTEHARLGAEIAEHDRRYHGEDAPVISDADYDALRRRYVELEEAFPTLAPFVMLNRMGLTVLLHPESGRPRDDHTLHAAWMGEVLPLKTEVLRETDA